MSINLDLRTDLAKVRAAYTEHKLEAQTKPGQCRYTGPCAIGVMIAPAQRYTLDRSRPGAPSYSRIAAIVEGTTCRIKVANGQLSDLTKLQDAHDAWSLGRGTSAAFLNTLEDLEAKYAPAAA